MLQQSRYIYITVYSGSLVACNQTSIDVVPLKKSALLMLVVVGRDLHGFPGRGIYIVWLGRGTIRLTTLGLVQKTIHSSGCITPTLREGDDDDDESEEENVAEVEQVEVISSRRLGSSIPLGEQIK